MRAYEVIRKKRDGESLSPAEIAFMIEGFTAGRVPDYQMSALLMAIVLRGLSALELAAWTQAMLESGRILDLSAIPGKKVDKHSTGGVGDKISIPLAPLVAACGVKVPMVSGRGLGHTGGTLDKLQSVPGFRVDLTTAEYAQQVAKVGCALIGQTAEIAPADKKLYALRDVTATVESIPLIASSIMSKKLAEGIDALVLDVKVGRGAFMKSLPQARALARTMVSIGRGMRKKVVALLTDMDRPLGRTVGNALEMRESFEVLQGNGPPDVNLLVTELGARMLQLGGVVKDVGSGRVRLRDAIRDGSGLEKMAEIVAAQGGDARAVRDPSLLPAARHTLDLPSPRAGVVVDIDPHAVGVAALILGAGRETVDDVIDPAVGVEILAPCLTPVKRGQPIARIHYNADARLEEARLLLQGAWRIGPRAPKGRGMILGSLHS